MRRAIASLFVLLAGCSPTLRGDHFYSCADDHCPPGYVCHTSDSRCYRSPEDAAAIPDGGPMLDTGMSGTCTGNAIGTCPGGQSCVMGQWTMPPNPPSYACARPLDVANALHGSTCVMGPGACTAPDACMNDAGTMRCMRPCGMPTDTCGFGEGCVILMGGAHTCVPMCNTSGPPCPMFGFTCSASEGNHCVPPGW